MSPKAMSIVIGGLLPALLFGISGVCQKACARAGIATGPYLIGIGLTLLVLGGVFTACDQDWTVNSRSASLTALFGLFWGTSVGCIAIALRRYDGQISQLVPLYNMNTLVAVVIGLVALAEWQSLNVGRLLVAAVFIIVGGVLAATS